MGEISHEKQNNNLKLILEFANSVTLCADDSQIYILIRDFIRQNFQIGWFMLLFKRSMGYQVLCPQKYSEVELGLNHHVGELNHAEFKQFKLSIRNVHSGIFLLRESPDSELADLFYGFLYQLSFVSWQLTQNESKNYLVQRKGYEFRIQNLKKEVGDLRRVAEFRKNFLSQMSHEIRTPLNAICGMNDLLKDSEKSSDEIINGIREVSKILMFVVNEVLELSRLEESGVELRMKPFDIMKLLAKLENIYQPKIQPGVDFKTNANLLNHKLRLGDEFRLQQILGNILGNAAKFTEKGSISVDVFEKPNSRIEFHISDTGKGISDSKKHLLFQKFAQENSKVVSTYGGSGLGLFICKELVELMEGHIWVEDNHPTGSVFKIEIPLDIVGSGAVIEAEELIEADDSQTFDFLPENFSILVVDDTKLNIVLMKRFLEKFNCHKVFVNCGEQALEEIKDKSFDLILLDMNMPGMSGDETTFAIRNMEKNLGINPSYIVAYTADAMVEKERLLGVGYDDLLLKPLSFKKFQLFLKKRMQG